MLKKTIQTFLSMFGVLGINVLTSIILARGLTPDDRGIYLGVTMWNGFVLGLCDIGIYLATVYLWGNSRTDERKDMFTTLFLWALGTGAVTLLVFYFLADWMIKGHLQGPQLMWAYLYFATSVAGPLTSMTSGVLAAEERFSLMNLVRVGIPAIFTVFWVVYFFSGTMSISVCLITSAFISFFSVIPFLWQTRAYLFAPGRFRPAIFRKGFWYGLKGHGGSIITVFGNNGTQILLFSLAPSALAMFQTATSATALLWAIPRAIGYTSLPNLVKEEKEQLHEKVCRFIRLTVLSTLIGAVLLGLAEPVLIPLLYGTSYIPAIWPALILLPNALFGGLAEVMANALNSTGRTLHNTIASAVYVCTILGCMAVTIHAWGTKGAAVSIVMGSVMSFLVRFIWYCFAVQRTSLRDIVPRRSDFLEVTELGLRMLGKVTSRLQRKMKHSI